MKPSDILALGRGGNVIEIGESELPPPKPGTCGTCKFWLAPEGQSALGTCTNAEAGLGARLPRSRHSLVCKFVVAPAR